MKASGHTTKIKIVSAAVILGVAYLYLSSPGEVVVQDNGKVVGLINQAREVLQGKGLGARSILRKNIPKI